MRSVFIMLFLFLSIGNWSKATELHTNESPTAQMSEKLYDWDKAYKMVGDWQKSTNINVKEWKALNLSDADLKTLTATTHSGIRVYLALDKGVLKGVAIQTALNSGKHVDVTPKNPIHGQKPFYCLLTLPGKYGSDIMTSPKVGTTGETYSKTADNHIPWISASKMAYDWQYEPIAKGSDIKAVFIPKVDLDESGKEQPNEWGVRIWLVKNGKKYKAVVTGIDSKGHDLVPTSENDNTYKAYDFCTPCPDDCGDGNGFNGL